MPEQVDPHDFDTLIARLGEVGARLPDSTLILGVPQNDDWRFFLALCDAFPSASEAQRRRLRDEMGRYPGLTNHLLGFVHAAAARLSTEKDPVWLDRGLAAAAIPNDTPDPRDYLAALAELYVSAEEAGIDPEPPFGAAGGAVPPDFSRYAVVRSRRGR